MSGYYIAINQICAVFRVTAHGVYNAERYEFISSDYERAKAHAQKLADEFGLHVHDNVNPAAIDGWKDIGTDISEYVAEGLGENIDFCPSDNS